MSRKRGGCGTFIIGFLTGLLSFVILVVGGGVLAYYKLNIKTVESWTNTEVPVGNDEFKSLPLKDLIALAGQLVGSGGNLTIGALERDYGITLPDEIGGMDLTRVKEVIRDCVMTDVPAMLNAITANMNLEEIVHMMGSGTLPSTIEALKEYTVDDLLGQNGGKGLEGILSEVPIGKLLNVTNEAETDELIWLLRDYTLLGEETGVQNMAEDLSLADLSAMGVSFDNTMLRAIASRQETDESGDPLFVGADPDSPIVFADGAFRLKSDPAETVDVSGYAVLPGLTAGGLTYDADNKLIFTDAAGAETLTYDAIGDHFLREDGTVYEFSGEALRPKLWPVAQLGSSIDSLTLGELLGDELPDALRSVADTRLDDLGSIGADKIYISDIVPEGADEGDLLFRLSRIPGRTAIDEDGDPATPEKEARTYRLGETELYLIEGIYYRYDGERYEPFTVEDESALEPVSYTVADIRKAVDELTLTDVLGKQPEGVMAAFADVKVGELDEKLSSDNIFLEDIAGENPEGLLARIAGIQGEILIEQEAGDGVPAVNGRAKLYRRRDAEGNVDKTTAYYVIGMEVYVRTNGIYLPAEESFDPESFVPLSYPVSRAGDAIRSLTMDDIFEGEVPAMLEDFRYTSVEELKTELTLENLKLKSLAAGRSEDDLLWKLANVLQQTTIQVGDRTYSADTYHRSAADATEVYAAAGRYYILQDGVYEEISLDEGEIAALVPVASDYSAAEINTAVNALTIGDFFGEQTSGALTLIGQDTKLKDVPQAMSEAVTNTRLYDLQRAGLLGSVTQEQLQKSLPVNGEMVALGEFNIVTLIEYVVSIGE